MQHLCAGIVSFSILNPTFIIVIDQAPSLKPYSQWLQIGFYWFPLPVQICMSQLVLLAKIIIELIWLVLENIVEFSFDFPSGWKDWWISLESFSLDWDSAPLQVQSLHSTCFYVMYWGTMYRAQHRLRSLGEYSEGFKGSVSAIDWPNCLYNLPYLSFIAYLSWNPFIYDQCLLWR